MTAPPAAKGLQRLVAPPNLPHLVMTMLPAAKGLQRLVAALAPFPALGYR